MLFCTWTLCCLSDLSTLTKVKALRVSAVTPDMDLRRYKQVNLAVVTFSFTCGSHANFLCSLFKLHWDMEGNQSGIKQDVEVIS